MIWIDFLMGSYLVPNLGSTEQDSSRSHSHNNERPIAARDRLVAIDVLRGAALLGILVMNIDVFNGPIGIHSVPVGTAKTTFVGWHATLDLCYFAIKWMFFEGKMRVLFSMLYGAGIVLLTERLERTGREAADIFCRRNLWLLLFGVLHGTLIWSGDILSQYAIVALLFMYPLRHVAAKWLIIVGLSIGVVGGTFGVIRTMGVNKVLAAERLREDGLAALGRGAPLSTEQRSALDAEAKKQAQAPARIAKQVAKASTPYIQSIGSRTDHYFGWITVLFHKGWILEVIGGMMLGMGLFKSGFLVGASTRRTYLLTAAVGYAISLPIVITGVMMSKASGFSEATVMRWMYLPYAVEVFPGALANASMLLLFIKSGALAVPLQSLANVGRTAFSNYILTSLICQVLYFWGPWQLYGKLEYYQEIYVIAGTWAVILVGSALWLKHFSWGPLEWIWRSLVYLRPLRSRLHPNYR